MRVSSDMPPRLEERLAVIDVKYVKENAAQLLTLAYEGLIGVRV